MIGSRVSLYEDHIAHPDIHKECVCAEKQQMQEKRKLMRRQLS